MELVGTLVGPVGHPPARARGYRLSRAERARRGTRSRMGAARAGPIPVRRVAVDHRRCGTQPRRCAHRGVGCQPVRRGPVAHTRASLAFRCAQRAAPPLLHRVLRHRLRAARPALVQRATSCVRRNGVRDHHDVHDLLHRVRVPAGRWAPVSLRTLARAGRTHSRDRAANPRGGIIARYGVPFVACCRVGGCGALRASVSTTHRRRDRRAHRRHDGRSGVWRLPLRHGCHRWRVRGTRRDRDGPRAGERTIARRATALR